MHIGVGSVSCSFRLQRAIPRASDRGASNGSSLHASFLYALPLLIIIAESGVYRLFMFDMKLNRLLIAIGLCLCGVAYAQDLSMVIDKKGRVGFADSSGKQVIKCIYESARPFADGYAIVMKSGKYGIIDTKGKVVLPLKFNSLTSWNEELYLAKSGKVSGLVNKQALIPQHYYKYNFLST